MRANTFAKVATWLIITTAVGGCSTSYFARKKTEIEKAGFSIAQADSTRGELAHAKPKIMKIEGITSLMAGAAGQCMLFDYAKVTNKNSRKAYCIFSRLSNIRKDIYGELGRQLENSPGEFCRFEMFCTAFRNAMEKNKVGYKLANYYSEGMLRSADCDLSGLLFVQIGLEKRFDLVGIVGQDTTRAKPKHFIVGLRRNGKIEYCVETNMLLATSRAIAAIERSMEKRRITSVRFAAALDKERASNPEENAQDTLRKLQIEFLGAINDFQLKQLESMHKKLVKLQNPLPVEEWRELMKTEYINYKFDVIEPSGLPNLYFYRGKQYPVAKGTEF